MEIGERTKKLLALHERYGARNYAPFPIVMARAKGSILWDTDNRDYLDFHCCYSAVGEGYGNVRLKKAIESQIDANNGLGGAVARGAVLTDQLILLEKELAELAGMDRVLLMNSGSEAVETAVQLVRKWAYTVKGVQKNKAQIIGCRNNFHGRGLAARALSTEKHYKEHFGPLPRGFRTVPFGDIKALERAVNNPNTAAFIVEPIQGEGGIVLPPNGYLRNAHKICAAHHVPFVLDEIQTGLGRTGKLFAHEWFDDTRPDIMLLGKFLGGGITPISAVVSSSELMCFEPGEHGSTYGGNPFSCAVARQVLRDLKNGGLITNALQKGTYLLKQLRAMRSPYVKEVRGKGLLIGIELKKDAPSARELVGRLLEHGLICSERGQGSLKGRVIGVTPALNIKDYEIEEGLKIIKSVLEGET